ncbi:hypothetical protein RFI_12230 [Reticulomyxa filosa]|uniref:Tyrosine-protein phosphatase domain-containing protein n=1 Tax=Reticulomyxa filosa TaxID=46433 RepID=X6NHW5_RETFI|nr:hypothetical protein RFI_12230 [Reticulomyxa filosa]|eukprot:ETO24927.1 hypothetical protein RFI_12230 [Reticulomyxa filosa]
MAKKQQPSKKEAPKKVLDEILFKENDKNSSEFLHIVSQPLKEKPSQIIDDWLFLGTLLWEKFVEISYAYVNVHSKYMHMHVHNKGNRMHSASPATIETLGITHVLNVTNGMPNCFPEKLKYANISILDEDQVDIYQYFEAAAQFIDECNPYYLQSKHGEEQDDEEKEQKKPRILVRSATVVISYLMSRHVKMSNEDKAVLEEVRQTNQKNWEEMKKVEELERKCCGCFPSSCGACCSRNVSEAYTLNKAAEQNGTLSLGDAFHYVQKKRNIICPNQSFCRQLTDWEEYLHHSNHSSVPFQSSSSLLPMYRNRFLQDRETSQQKACHIL